MFAFDFDGVMVKQNAPSYEIHKLNPNPNKKVISAIRILSKKGHKIIIHSKRSNNFLRKYCVKHNIPFDYINKNPLVKGDNPGKPVASAYIDDRAYQYKGQNTKKLVHDLIKFQPYWKK